MSRDRDIVEELLQLVPHLEVAHHVAGRIRLRIRPSALGLIQKIDVEDMMRSIPGVLSLRVNAAARSVVLEYNQKEFPDTLWRDIARMREKPELTQSVSVQLHNLFRR